MLQVLLMRQDLSKNLRAVGLFCPWRYFIRGYSENMLFLMGGTFVNCVITVLRPGISNIADVAINPTQPDISEMRVQG
jgi:hypothetical protein